MSLISQEVKRYENPLLKGIKEIEINNEKITINNINAKKYFNNIIYCCIIDKTKNSNYYMNTLIDEKEYNSIINNFVIFKINNNNIIMNPYFSSIMKVVSKKDISVFNKLNIPLDNFNLVINFTNINYNNINSFIKMFEQKLSIEEFINNIYLADYYKIDNNVFNDKLKKMLQNLDGYNNNIVINKKIKSRKTQFYHGYININSMNYIKNDNIKYHKQIIQLIKYFIKNKPKSLVLLLTYFLSNKFYISCLLKSNYVLNNVFSKIDNNSFIFKESLKKAFKILYNIELALDTNIKQNDEIVFDINTVSIMPRYNVNYMSPYNISDIVNNTNYISGLTEKKYSKINFCNRIANLEEFKKQMNVFITGDVKKNIFENIDLSKYNASLVGSIIPACSIVNHPLIFNFINLRKTIDIFNYYNSFLHRFYAEYYSEADIDIMLYNTNMFTYIDNANNFMNKLILECAKKQNNINNLKFYKIKKKLSVRVMLTNDMIKENFKNIDINIIHKYKSLSPNIISKLSNTDKKQATEIYNIINKIFIDKYPSIYKYDYNKLSEDEKNKIKNTNFIEFQDIKNIIDNNIDIEFHIRMYNKFSIYWSWKYSIESPFLLHNFEVFNAREKEPFSLISKFHLNCVKGYYTKNNENDNVYLLPSCIIALQTFHNISMSYFHGKSNKYEIINKYRMRGFGTNLNKTDMIKIKKFITENKFWRNLYPKLNINNKLHLGNELFMPRLRNMDYYNNSKYIIDIENLYNEDNKTYF